MKKVLFILLALAVVTISVDMLFAAGVGHNVNQSAEFVRMPSRNASTDVDAVFFNPAGTTSLANGLHLSVSNQFIFQTRTVEDDTISPYTSKLEDEYTGETNVYLFPNFYAVYKMDQLAINAGMAPVGGGGTVDFSDGLPMFYWAMAQAVASPLIPGTNNMTAHSMNFKGSSSIIMGQIGAAYEITPMVSVAVGGRYVYAKETAEGEVNWSTTGTVVGANTASAKLENERTGAGYGAVLGVNVKPMQGLNVGLRYEWYSTLEVENDTTATSSGTGAVGATMATGVAAGVAALYADGEKVKITLPQVIGLGVGYQIMPGLTTQFSLTYALNKQVDHDSGEDYYNNSVDVALGFEYVIMPGLKASIGYIFSQAAYKDDIQAESDNDLANHSVGLGGAYTVMPGLDVNLGFIYTYYIDKEIDSQSTGKVTLGKTSYDIAIGVTYKAL